MLMYGGLSFAFTTVPVIVRHPAEAGHKYGHVCARQCGSADFSGSKIIAPSASLFLSPPSPTPTPAGTYKQVGEFFQPMS